MFGRPKPSILLSKNAPPPLSPGTTLAGGGQQLTGNPHSFPGHALLAELVRYKRVIMILLVIYIRLSPVVDQDFK